MSVSGQLHLLGPWISEIFHLIQGIKMSLYTGRHLSSYYTYMEKNRKIHVAWEGIFISAVFCGIFMESVIDQRKPFT